jgi:hypothetical protein
MESIQEKIETADRIIEMLFVASILIVSFCVYMIYKTQKIKLPK